MNRQKGIHINVLKGTPVGRAFVFISVRKGVPLSVGALERLRTCIVPLTEPYMHAISIDLDPGIFI